MTRDLTAVSEDTTLKRVTAILDQHRFSGVPVVDANNSVIGFISEKDIINSACTGQFSTSDDLFVRNFALIASQISEVGDRYVKDYMVRDVHSVTEDEDLTNLAEMMISKNLKYVPVVRNGRLVGMVSRTAVCRSLLGNGKQNAESAAEKTGNSG